MQQRLEEALSVVANEPVDVVCAGRTDTGVHASGQVIHFDTSRSRDDRGWLRGANSNLPDDICATWAKHVDDQFHARFSATGRNYRYRILNCAQRSALHRHRAWWVRAALDAERMHGASQLLLGKHDFTSFRAAGCGAATPCRNVTHISVERVSDWITLKISANAFLQHMVRNIVGALAAVGEGEREIGWLAELIECRDRKKSGIAAPPHGLTLLSVEYPAIHGIPAAVDTDIITV